MLGLMFNSTLYPAQRTKCLGGDCNCSVLWLTQHSIRLEGPNVVDEKGTQPYASIIDWILYAA